MAWLEVHQTLPQHRKTLRAARLAGVSSIEIVGFVLSLWLWSLDNAPDGEIAVDEFASIAGMLGWRNDTEQLLSALLGCGTNRGPGFLEEIEDRLSIHDWESYAGRLIHQRSEHRQRSARQRNAKESENAARSVRAACAQRAHLHYTTLQNSTEKSSPLPPQIANADLFGEEPPKNGAPEKGKAASRKKRPAKQTAPPDERFERFWTAYPRKIGKGKARESFQKVAPGDELLERMLSAVEAQKGSRRWRDENGRYIPLPVTWLNQERWDDEVEPEAAPPPKPKYERIIPLKSWQKEASDDDNRTDGN